MHKKVDCMMSATGVDPINHHIHVTRRSSDAKQPVAVSDLDQVGHAMAYPLDGLAYPLKLVA
jgi:hypothetical protein